MVNSPARMTSQSQQQSRRCQPLRTVRRTQLQDLRSLLTDHPPSVPLHHVRIAGLTMPTALCWGTGVTMSFTFQQVGTKFVRLTITDAQAQAASVEHDVVVSSPPSNLPIVSAGADQTITLPASATLSGSASSPTGAPLTTSWSKVTGTGTVTFGNPGALSTTASFSAAAVYVLRLTATDGVLSNSSDVMITVNSAPITDANFYVSTTGNDSNAGSSTSPWRNIQKAA